MINAQVQLEQALGEKVKEEAPKRRRVQTEEKVEAQEAEEESLFATGRRVQ